MHRSAAPPGIVSATTYAVWSKQSDLEIHARVVAVTGHLTVIELRDFIVSTAAAGRGSWMADSPTAREVLDVVTTASGTAVCPAPPVGTVLGLLPKAPAIDLVLSCIQIDAAAVVEMREMRGGVSGRGYWIPWDQRAEGIVRIAAAYSERLRRAS